LFFQQLFFDVNPINKRNEDGQNNYNEAQPIVERKAQSDKGKKRSGIGRVSDKLIKPFDYQLMIVMDGQIHGEKMSKRPDRKKPDYNAR